ncbi:hypothetical protein [cf. Phormidesmis sp. LEGE 11477]|uniref:hypothetical protein n=1 Tax=cf. Phormidesmis sp. LEGE 11477 TaxID=1828680 RepID=UPI00187F0FBA|nr:hypothetical protein [cf. Phormidesmis sp. LEGE 11477]
MAYSIRLALSGVQALATLSGAAHTVRNYTVRKYKVIKMAEENKKVTDTELSDDQLKDVAGGNDVHKTRLEHLDNQTKSVENVQETRLEHLDNQTK